MEISAHTDGGTTARHARSDGNRSIWSAHGVGLVASACSSGDRSAAELPLALRGLSLSWSGKHRIERTQPHARQNHSKDRISILIPQTDVLRTCECL